MFVCGFCCVFVVGFFFVCFVFCCGCFVCLFVFVVLVSSGGCGGLSHLDIKLSEISWKIFSLGW